MYLRLCLHMINAVLAFLLLLPTDMITRKIKASFICCSNQLLKSLFLCLLSKLHIVSYSLILWNAKCWRALHPHITIFQALWGPLALLWSQGNHLAFLHLLKSDLFLMSNLSATSSTKLVLSFQGVLFLLSSAVYLNRILSSSVLRIKLAVEGYHHHFTHCYPQVHSR